MEFAVGVSILNFVEIHGAKEFEFVVYSDSRLPTLKSILSKQGVSVDVIKYKPRIRWLSLYSSRAVAFFSPLVLSKFEIFNNLKKYKRVVWLDYDIVIKKPLWDLLNQNHFDLACVTSSQPIRNAFINPPPGIDDKTLADEGISAGLLVVKESFPDYQSASKALYETCLKHISNLYYPEQGIFDIYLHDAPYKWLELEGQMYCDNPEVENTESFIVHAWGPRKFWNGRRNDEWSRYYDFWLNLGGSRYVPSVSKLKGYVRRLSYVLATIVIATVRLSRVKSSL
jgi:lipopolysaccharide biosynthesis glycosyltransferase